MSGINPLIDTLLHQVLGKRVDTPPPRALNEPVKPIAPSDAPRALHSDSRLDARHSSVPLSTPLSELARTTREGAPAPATAGQAAPASTQIHFSPSARTIADLLVRYPAPPSTLTSAAPLAGDADVSSPSRLAQQLQGSVRDSGLFYESHLARWYRGELPRQQLEREPQMWRTQTFTPAPASPGGARFGPMALAPHPLMAGSPRGEGLLASPGERGAPAATAGVGTGISSGIGSGAAPASGVSAPGSPSGPATATPPTAMPAAGEAREALIASRSAPEEMARQVRSPSDPLHESLQGIVRHQLEMLVTPVLRWEGDVWSGLFMALVIHLPPGHEGGDPQDEEAHREQERRGWRSELALEVAGLGEVQVSLWLRGQRLDMDLSSRDPAVLAQLEQGLGRLESRLEAAGLSEVRLRALPLWPEARS